MLWTWQWLLAVQACLLPDTFSICHPWSPHYCTRVRPDPDHRETAFTRASQPEWALKSADCLFLNGLFPHLLLPSPNRVAKSHGLASNRLYGASAGQDPRNSSSSRPVTAWCRDRVKEESPEGGKSQRSPEGYRGKRGWQESGMGCRKQPQAGAEGSGWQQLQLERRLWLKPGREGEGSKRTQT